jgi:hypothetical protein
MGKRRAPFPSAFEANPFMQGFLDWMDSPQGELSVEVCDAVQELLEDAQVDARERKILFPDGQRLDIDASVHHIQTLYPQFPSELIETHLIGWLELGYAPAGWSQQQLDELDRLTERWITDHTQRRRAR